MYKTIFAIMFRPQSLNTILRSFDKTIVKLGKLENAAKAEKARNEQLIRSLEAENVSHALTAEQAASVAGKIKNLIN